MENIIKVCEIALERPLDINSENTIAKKKIQESIDFDRFKTPSFVTDSLLPTF